jgi:iron complex outermembrane recepter protein
VTVTDFWRLTGTYTFTQLDLREKSGSTDTSAEDIEDRTPEHQFSLRSNLNLPWNVAFDTMLYWVDRLPNQGVDAYARLDLRLAWMPIEDLELSVAGLNLTEEHREFPTGAITQASRVPRSVYGSVRWSF